MTGVTGTRCVIESCCMRMALGAISIVIVAEIALACCVISVIIRYRMADLAYLC